MVRPGTTRLVGLTGYPLKHSISPIFQQAAFDYHLLPVEYQAWETPPDQLEAVVTRVRQPDCLGMNVTVPHKEAIVRFLDEVVAQAREIGAVNTVHNQDGRLIGHNTDAMGFLKALEEDAGYESEGKQVVLLGAGGAARAVAVALLGAGVSRLTIANRTLGRAAALAQELRRGEATVEAVSLSSPALRRLLAGCSLVVNATSVGMKHGPAPHSSPLPAEFIPPEALVFDLVYNPPITRLLHLAQQAGARTMNGLSMLVYQGAAAFEIWTGREPPLGLMLERARRAIQ